MISVGVLVPTWRYFLNPYKLQPLYELYFATVLKERLQDIARISIIDLREHRDLPNDGSVAEEIPEKDIYIYWIMKTADYPEIENIVHSLSKKFPNSKHAAGGTHVENLSEDCSKLFDSIVIGPGENSLIDIVKTNCEKSKYDADWKYADYNEWPIPDRSFLPEKTIVSNELFSKYGDIRGTSVYFSRGCPYRCSFCVYNVPNRLQLRSNKNIAAEINYLKKEYDIYGFNLRDEVCVPTSERIARPFLETIGEGNIVWRGQTTIGSPKGMFELAKQSGCLELTFGVESVSELALEIINKKQDMKQIRTTIELVKNLGITVRVNLIIGLPGEPKDILQQTIKFINETDPQYVSVSGFCPVLGSPTHKEKSKYGIKIIERDWNKHAHLMYRFSNEEEFGLPFEYEEMTEWGKSFTKDEIANNIRDLQQFLRERGKTY